MKPLRQLTEKNAKFQWTSVCQKAFDDAKSLLLSSNFLVHYDPTKEMIVHTDASPVGVLNHKFVNPDGSTVEQPVLFASCSLTQVQQRYAQIDR